MPKKDGTGPQGRGSRTGRGLGRCNPTGQASVLPGQGGMGSGRGAGRGRGKGTGQGFDRGQGKGRGRQ